MLRGLSGWAGAVRGIVARVGGEVVTILSALREWWHDFLRHADAADIKELSQQRDYYLRKVQELNREISKRQQSGVMSR